MNTSEKKSESNTGKHSSGEDWDYPVKRHKNEELKLDEPSTSGIASNFYNVESSAPKKTLHGLTYQLRLLMLFVQRIPDGQEFFLSTEMHEAGLFDDIVLKYLQDGIWRYRFLQAKHKNDDTYKIKKMDLFNKKSKSKKRSQSSKNVGETKPYLLKKYFESYCAIKENSFFKNADLEEFLICTNVGLDDEAMTYFTRIEENNDSILGTLGDFKEINDMDSNPIKLRLKKKKIPELKKDFELNSQNKNCFSNFFKKFRFLTNYEDNELNESIKYCLKKYLKMENVDLANAYLQGRVLKWFESYKDNKSNYLLVKDKKEFLKSLNYNIESLLVAGYSNFYIKELKSYGVEFDNILPLHEFFGQKKCKIMFIITVSPKLSIIKLSQLFSELKLSQDEVILTNGEQLNCNKEILTTFVNEPSYKWLVIEYYHNEIKLGGKMLDNILKIDSKKTVVIIGQEYNVLKFNKCLRLKIPCFEDKNNSFKDLTIVSQEKILERGIIFQGEKVSLNELIDIYAGKNIIDELTLEKILTETIKIGNNCAYISDFLMEDCYVRRTLVQKELRLEILQNDDILKACLFFISGINRDQLKHLKINNEWVFMWEKSKIYTNGIILCNKITSEDKMIEQYRNKKENVFWIEHSKGKFLIVNIRNQTDILYKHNICLEEHELNKKQILEKKIIIVADGPGCGKSIFMTKVARQLKQIMSNIWVLRINLSSYAYKQKGQKQFVKSLEDIEFLGDETNKAIEFMADLLFPHKYKKQNKHFVRELLIYSLHCLNENMKCPKIILLFDGFDEISPIFRKKVLALLQAFRNSNVAQMWIATRNHEELSLEVALHSSPFRFNPLNMKEKIDFFKNLWRYNLLNFDNIKHKTYSDGVLTYLKDITNNICKIPRSYINKTFLDIRNHGLPISSDSKLQQLLNCIDFSEIAEHIIYNLEYFNVDKISGFTHNLLQLKMMGDIYFFKKFSPLKRSAIFSLYDEFIEYKWTVFRDDKKAVGNCVIGHELFEDQLKYLTKVHQEIAFQSLFSQYDNIPFREVSNKIALSRAGLIVIHDDRLEFVHQSFAEYFVGQYFAENFHSEDIQKIMFSDILIKENFLLMRKFLNNNKIFLEKLGSKSQQMNEIIRVNSFDSLNQMLKEELYNLFKKFLENLPLDIFKRAILFNENDARKTVLHTICDFIEDEQILENIFKAITDSHSSETFNELVVRRDHNEQTAIHTTFYTIFRDRCSIVKYKLMFFKLNCNSKLFYELLLDEDEKGKTILHIACEYGRDITYLLEVTDKTKEAISKLLLKTDNDGFTALYYTIFRSNNYSLLKTLIYLSISLCNIEITTLFAIRSQSYNLLHHACFESNEDNLVNLLDALKDDKDSVAKILLETDINGLSVLHYTVLKFFNFEKPKILLDFVNSNCSIEMLHSLLCKRNRFGTNILHIAVQTVQIINDQDSLTPFLTYLFNLVKNIEIFYELLLTSDNKGKSVLHFCSLESRYSFLLKELLDFVEAKCSSNILSELLLKLDEDKCNILHYICHKGSGYNLTVLLNKIKDKTDLFNKLLFQTDSDGLSVLHYTLSEFNLAKTKILLDFVNSNCSTETLHTLLCKTTCNGITILHMAVNYFKVTDSHDSLTSLLTYLFNLVNNSKEIFYELLLTSDKLEQTVLHYSSSDGKSYQCPFLLRELLDFVQTSCSANIFYEILLKLDEDKCNILHYVCCQNNGINLTFLLNKIKDNTHILNKLLFQTDRDGLSVLHYTVIKFSNLAKPKMLLDFVNLNCSTETLYTLLCKRTSCGTTILHMAVQNFEATDGHDSLIPLLKYLLNLVKNAKEIFYELLLTSDNDGRTVLYYSVFKEKRSQYPFFLKELLDFVEENCSADILDELLLKSDDNNANILHYACVQNHVIYLTFLLNKIKDKTDILNKLLLQTDSEGLNVLHYTIIKFFNPAKLKILLDFVNLNCSIETLHSLLCKRSRLGTILHIAMVKFEVAYGLDSLTPLLTYLFNLVKNCKEIFYELLLASDYEGQTVLHCSSFELLYPFFLKELLDFVRENCSANILDELLLKLKINKCNILHCVCYENDASNLTFLLNEIKDKKEILKKLLFQTDCDGFSVLHYTMLQFFNLEKLKILLDFVRSNCSTETLHEIVCQRTLCGATILHTAVHNTEKTNGHDSLISLLTYLFNLLKNSKEIFDELLLISDNQGRTILHHTFLNLSQYPFLLKELLDFVQANCNANIFGQLLLKLDDNNASILHYICYQNDESNLTRFLNKIKNNIEILNELLFQTDCYGNNPLHYSLFCSNNPSLLKILLDFTNMYCSNLLDTHLLKETNDGCSLLHLACKYNNEENFKYLLNAIKDKVPIVNELVLKADHNGETVLHYTVCNFQMLKSFLDFVELNCSKEIFTKLILKYDKKDRTGLHVSCRNGDNEEIVTYLLNSVKNHTTPEVFNTFLFKKDCHGKDALDYI